MERAGSIWMTGSNDVLVSMCAHWDTTATADIYHFAQAATGYPCRNIIVRGGRCGAVTGSANNFFADSSCTNILIDSFGEWGTPPVVSSPAAQDDDHQPHGGLVHRAAGYEPSGRPVRRRGRIGRQRPVRRRQHGRYRGQPLCRRHRLRAPGDGHVRGRRLRHRPDGIGLDLHHGRHAGYLVPGQEWLGVRQRRRPTVDRVQRELRHQQLGSRLDPMGGQCR